MSLIKSISGIRGTIGGFPGANLTPVDIMKYSLAFGYWVREQEGNRKIVVGRDARVSGQMVSNIVVGALQSIGMDVVDLGLSTTPTVEIAVHEEKAGGGIIITASHNPKQWNALKLLNSHGEFISARAGEEVLRIVEDKTIEFEDINGIGSYTFTDEYIDRHIEKILKLKLVDRDAIAARNFKIAVDAVNSTGGIAVPRLLRALGVQQIIEINCEPNGLFAHNPEPLPENLHELSSVVKRQNADLGIAVDPDVDRLALVCEDGSMFGEEYTLVAVADYVLSKKKGSTVSNLSSTRALRDVTERYGCSYFASAVGEVNVVEKMKEVKAVIGGEGNGGIIYPELHYGRDALVGIALFLTYIAKSKKSASMLRATYPNYYIAKKKIELDFGANIELLFDKIENKYKKYPINTEDGVKIEFENDWVHLRRSNTEPIIRIYAESHSETTANNIAEQIMKDLKQFSSDISR
ncbi:MAG: phosphoglucosamine mutase [Chitinophagales bacterium]|nr:phosphoglucosamine mutase [Chitinophagales bacterium]MDW8418068.1 phosphoglucosamine mutase [Chitinophagales bacterium]